MTQDFSLCSNSQVLANNEAHLWVIHQRSSYDDAIYEACSAIVSAQEKQRILEFRSDKRKRQYLLSRGALRHILSYYQPETHPRDIALSINEFGKPIFYETSNPIRFNLSHSNDTIIVGVSYGCDIGVDIEYIRKERSFSEIEKAYFHPKECAEIRHNGYDADEMRRRFYKVWTLKEAFYKVHGKGVTISPSDFYFERQHETYNIILKDEQEDASVYASSLQFWQTYFDTDYSIAVALDKTKRNLQATETNEQLKVTLKTFALDTMLV
ncbi:MAG: 4'-phosphopantetheinyl transferase superfamily protein [Pseudomonadota bacterium]